MAKIKMSSVKGKSAKNDIKTSKKSPKSKSEERYEDIEDSEKKFTLIRDFMLGTGDCDVLENSYGLQTFDKLFMLREEDCGHYCFKIGIKGPEHCDYAVISTIHLSGISHAEIKQLFKYITEDMELFYEKVVTQEDKEIAQFKDIIYKRIEPKALYDAKYKKG